MAIVVLGIFFHHLISSLKIVTLSYAGFYGVAKTSIARIKL